VVVKNLPYASCECWFLDVGQGTSNVILLGEGRAIVIDCGPCGSQQTIKLLSRHVDTIEALIISHNDADHDYNVPQVLQQYRRATKNIFFLQDKPPTELPRTLGLLKEAKDGDFPVPRRLEVDGSPPTVLFSENGVELSVLYPDFTANLVVQASAASTANQTSAVLRLSCGNRRVVFSGDGTIDAWEYLTAKMPEAKPLPCDIMTVPHHGGSISNCATGERSHQARLYAELIKPEYAIISVGTSNRHNHPKRDTLDALVNAGVTVLCTQMTGVCCPELEMARSMRSVLAQPSRSRRCKSTTQSGRSKDVACFGSVVAEISTTHLQISGLSRYRRDIENHITTGGFDPACR